MVICDSHSGECKGDVTEQLDPFLLDVHDEYLRVQLCEFHYQERSDDI